MEVIVGDLQLKVLKIIWDMDRAAKVHDVHNAVNTTPGQKLLAYSTILTVMRNLAKRGILRQIPVGRSHDFEPVFTRDQFTKMTLKKTLQDFFEGDVDAFKKAVKSACTP